ncbi:MAG: hypothetical protein HZB29_05235 [Nitrospinae bacterium]|nr:hypothetical protein [Nitrospinota bacterium]
MVLSESVRKTSNVRMLFLCLAAALSMAFGATPAKAAEGKQDGHGFSSSKTCGECHKDIYSSFGRSLHSLSYSNPIFQLAYSKAYLETKGAARESCLKCHAPLAAPMRDMDVAQPVTAEGVTCDFCHSVESVDPGSSQPFKLDPSGKKRASLKDAKSPAHSAAYANWFNKSEMCAPCHEITSVHGMKTATTYSEWKASDYAKEGVQCQGCHMPPVSGKTAASKASSVNYHDHSLSHDLERMKGAVKLEIARAGQSKGDRYIVDVNATNVRAGHSIPTGTQPRELVIEVTVRDSSGRSETQRKTLGKKIASVTGAPIGPGGDACVGGHKMLENTSLKSKEKRQVRFMFTGAFTGNVSVSADAHLVYAPVVTAVENVRIPLGSVAR